MTAPLPAIAAEDGAGRWSWPISPPRDSTAVAVRPAEARAVADLGVRNLRRLQHHDPSAPGWRVIVRLLGPLEAVNAALDSPPTPHPRRAMLDVVAVLLTRCAETGRTFWGWTEEEWFHLLGRTQAEFRQHAPAWAGDEVRPYLAAHAYLLGGFNEFHRLGSFQRLTLAWRIFGRDRVNGEVARLRAILSAWGYRLGRDEDTLLPISACQLFLLNRSPHLEDLDTALFDRVRRDGLLEGSRLNTLHAMQRAVAELGFCDPPRPGTGHHSARASGGAPIWEQWPDRWHTTSTLTPRVRGSVRSNLLKVGRWIAAEQPDAADPADWTRQTCASWIAALDRMKVGDYVQRTIGLGDRLGKPNFTDRRTGELVDPLFAVRARRVSTSYINNTIIPMLCRKAGVPAADVRGNITSHHARSTIASQLYNAKEPMTLFELQAWLGHRSPQSTQYYAKITPSTLSKAYSEACYFERNVRTIEVLVDRDAVASGAAAGGEPWQHYDLGHGYCSYTFFEQCQHRMACARCDFYTPKQSTRSQLLEAKSNLQKMTVSIPLTDDELAAVEDGQAALDRLLDRLADTPTPAGPTPRDLDVPVTARLLPVVDVRQGGTGSAPR
ncbi:site-specific integrase [Streptomyces sp. DSM 116496]|uniref:site-specific integrase n=1 Tax=Streptomyces stoeckheimensis TaxID=3344656 RepID=UPI0038B266E2